MTLEPLRNDLIPFLNPYLPRLETDSTRKQPFITLTYAQSLDSRISKGKGLRTTISHPETKTMTHYLRYHHDAILIGCGTALADDPGLNCKYAPDGQVLSAANSPRPVILDPHVKWKFKGSKMEQIFMSSGGKPPIVIVNRLPEPKDQEKHVTYLPMDVSPTSGKYGWKMIFEKLYMQFNLKSIMVEGGAVVINDLLATNTLVDSLIITIGAKYLGSQGVEASPWCGELALQDISWWKGTCDVVLCARPPSTAD
ncbi:LAMI_0C06656g1_1 [Lachancea mirantina]|uniref:2,5-diamino-6-ribosylamino-4(3H)-pyrimidinone 5'-phosphate reductase n=1 Tax=Lachancea mirantina TaxID=1230905 RepID=A0A1G4J3A5_9SACH|nr:LAMI_0C06656g1_1 [Lachancea mirantina]